LPVALAEGELGAQQLVQQGRGQLDLGQARQLRFLLGLRRGFGFRYVRFGVKVRIGGLGAGCRLRNRLRLRRHSACRQHTRESYNDESVFQS